MKYIMFEDDKGRKIAVTFPDHLVHEDVARVLCYGMARLDNRVLLSPINAGFVELGSDVSVHGLSETLHLGHNPIDALRIQHGDNVAFLSDDIVAKIPRKPKT